MAEQSGEWRGEHRAEVRLAIAEASDLLGISKDAIRMRIKRGTIRSEKTDDRVHVWPNDVPDADQNTDANADSTAPIAAKDETIRTLREQLGSERGADEENRRLLAGPIERMPALDAGTEPSGSQEPSRALTSPRRGRGGISQSGQSPGPLREDLGRVRRGRGGGGVRRPNFGEPSFHDLR